MKRTILFSLLMSFAMMANAQFLSVKINGNTLNNGDTISVKATDDEARIEPTIHNSGFAPTTARINVEKLNETEIFVTSVCASLCVDTSLSAPFIIESSSDFEGAHIDFYVPEDAAMGIFKVTVYDTTRSQNNAFFFAKIFNANVGIEESGDRMTVKAYPNPTSGKAAISYRTESGRGELVIYDMCGRKLEGRALEGKEGQVEIDLSNYGSGLYLYGVCEEGQRAVLKKLVVK